MPRTRSLAWSELKIGILAVAAVVLAAMLILAVGGQGGFAWQRYELKTKFADVKGLKSGAVVRVAGVEVGKVTHVGLVGSEVEVTLEVNEENQQRITTESRASIGSLSLLGEPVIDITPSTQGTPLKDGGFLPAGRAAGQLSDVAQSATQSLEQLAGILSDIRAGKGTVGKLFTDEAVYKEVQESGGVCRDRGWPTESRRGLAGDAHPRSGGLQEFQQGARRSPGDDRSSQRRRGQPRPAAQR